MARSRKVALFMLVALCLLQNGIFAEDIELSKGSFPSGFIFGTASSAYQYEGAVSTGGRAPSIWDTFTNNPNNTLDGSNGSIANDQYHHYKEDIEFMSKMGMDSYRFSISWSRLIPEGRGRVNKIGVDYYNNMINGLLDKGIQPFVTLHHFDLPQTLQDAYGGWLSPQIVEDFSAFAETCFNEFGDRVKHWVTFNEPFAFVVVGYNNGIFPPQRCSKDIGECRFGNSSIEPYEAGHNVLLSHAKAVDIYRRRYQSKQGGSIGITLSTPWFLPYGNSLKDRNAAQRAWDFANGWFLNPVVFGDYPKTMRESVGDRLPSFTDTQRSLLEASVDFVGLNYYATYFAASLNLSNVNKRDFFADMGCYITDVGHGVSSRPTAALGRLFVNPSGIYSLVHYVKRAYNNLTMIITENGVSEANNASVPLSQALNDYMRVEYHKSHLSYLSKAVKDGADVRGYYVWSLLDDFEWTFGYSVRFGLYYVDFTTLRRYPKASVQWFTKFLHA